MKFNLKTEEFVKVDNQTLLLGAHVLVRNVKMYVKKAEELDEINTVLFPKVIVEHHLFMESKMLKLNRDKVVETIVSLLELIPDDKIVEFGKGFNKYTSTESMCNTKIHNFTKVINRFVK